LDAGVAFAPQSFRRHAGQPQASIEVSKRVYGRCSASKPNFAAHPTTLAIFASALPIAQSSYPFFLSKIFSICLMLRYSQVLYSLTDELLRNSSWVKK